MFKAIANEFRLIRDAIRAGNKYRLEKYGPAETFAESLEKAKKYNEWKKSNTPKTLPFFASASELHEIDKFKERFHYWDEWTGGRFDRRENPNYNTPKGNEIVPGSVCRSNPVTGYWE